MVKIVKIVNFKKILVWMNRRRKCQNRQFRDFRVQGGSGSENRTSKVVYLRFFGDVAHFKRETKGVLVCFKLSEIEGIGTTNFRLESMKFGHFREFEVMVRWLT